MMNSFVLPATFRPAEFLPLRLLPRADDARWLVSTILLKTANRDVDVWGCARLNLDILRRAMYQTTAVEIIRSLERGGAIEITPHCPHVKSRGFRLAKRYLGDRCVRVPIHDPRLRDRLERERQRLDAEERRARWLPVHYRLDAEQQALSITREADAILSTLPEHTRLCQDVLVNNLRRRELPFSVGTTGRVFNAITGLKRELRHALRIGGEPLGSVDIRCAQPGLLALALAQFTPPNVPFWLSAYKHTLPTRPSLPLPRPCPPALAASDSLAFGKIATSGGFYEKLVALTGLSRDSVKVALLRDVLAKRGRYPSPVEQAFREAFPSVLRFIRAVNRDDHGELIRYLQRMESWLVIEQVSPRLLGRVPCITLHDAIYSTLRGLPIVEAAFGETFDEIGYRLSLKREGAAPWRCCYRIERPAPSLSEAWHTLSANMPPG